MVRIQFSLIKKVKVGRPEHWLTPTPPTSDIISFLPPPPPPPSPLKDDVICASTQNMKFVLLHDKAADGNLTT